MSKSTSKTVSDNISENVSQVVSEDVVETVVDAPFEVVASEPVPNQDWLDATPLNDATREAAIEAFGLQDVVDLPVKDPQRARAFISLFQSGDWSEADRDELVHDQRILSEEEFDLALSQAETGPQGDLVHDNTRNAPSDEEIEKDEILEHWHFTNSTIPEVKEAVNQQIARLADATNQIEGNITAWLALAIADAAVIFLKENKLSIEPNMATKLHALLLMPGYEVFTKEQIDELGLASLLKDAEMKACLLACGHETKVQFGFISRDRCKGTRFSQQMIFEPEGNEDNHFRAICVPDNVLQPWNITVEFGTREILNDKGQKQVIKVAKARASSDNTVASLRYLNGKTAQWLYDIHFRKTFPLYDMYQEGKGTPEKVETPSGRLIGSETQTQRDAREAADRHRDPAWLASQEAQKQAREEASAKDRDSVPNPNADDDETDGKREKQLPGSEVSELAKLKAQLNEKEIELEAMTDKVLTTEYFVALSKVVPKGHFTQETAAAAIDTLVRIVEYHVVGKFDINPPSAVLQDALIQAKEAIDAVVATQVDGKVRKFRYVNRDRQPSYELTII